MNRRSFSRIALVLPQQLDRCLGDDPVQVEGGVEIADAREPLQDLVEIGLAHWEAMSERETAVAGRGAEAPASLQDQRHELRIPRPACRRSTRRRPSAREDLREAGTA
ncbi:MAG: hypothetical protein V3V67_19500 [Myxococcota bacterium]